MAETETIKKRMHTELKFNGFLLRSEFISLIVETLNDADTDLSNNATYDNIIKLLCESFEKETECERSIERPLVEKAVEICLRAGYDESETIFNVIDAYNFPKLDYNIERKIFTIDTKNKPVLLSKPDSRAELFINRYKAIKHRAQRNLYQKQMFTNEEEKMTLQTVDFLLTISHKALKNNLILGALLQGPNGKYFLEDPTGMIPLDLKHVRYHGGFFCEGCFVLVNGQYEDKILQVASMILPNGEEYNDSRITFGNINYFGGQSECPMRHSSKLQQMMSQNDSAILVFLSDLWLDRHIVFEKLEQLFLGFSESPPIAFVFMGNFLSTSYGAETLPLMHKQFKQLAELIQKHENILKYSQFVFVPGLSDPCIPYIVPKPQLPKLVSEDFKKAVPKSWFTSNPCRIQYCTRVIIIYKSEVLCKFVQESLNKPAKDKIDEYITRTIVSQGNLSPFSLNVQPVHWSFDYTLQLYPLPNLVVIGDKASPYLGKHKECYVTNPGSFIESGFSFKSYTPATDTVDDCCL